MTRYRSIIKIKQNKKYIRIKTINDKEVIIGLFFVYGMSLKTWVDTGIFDREKKIYELHLKQGHCSRIIWFTYGIGDERIREKLVNSGKLDDRIEVVGRPTYYSGKLGMLRYAINFHKINYDICHKLSVIKTDQMGAAWVAARVKKAYGIPFLLRTGYTYTLFKKHEISEAYSWYEKIKKRIWYCFYTLLENKMYHICDYATVSSKNDLNYIINRYGISSSLISVLTNYIDSSKFKPDISLQKYTDDRILYVGRLSEQKNLFNVIKAINELNLGIDICGAGNQKDELQQLALQNSWDVKFLEPRMNDELPKLYCSYRYFILGSFYEGMPKTLLEAMACGLECFGTNVEGICELIMDDITGYLIGNTDSESIKERINEVLQKYDKEIGNLVSKNAYEYIRANHSLTYVVDEQNSIIQKLMN